MLAAFLGVLFLGSLATELLLTTPTLGGLAWWGVAGVGLFGGGTAIAGVVLWQWIQSGFTELPLISADILAFTLIVLGLQTVFGSFFVGIAGE